MSVGPIPEDPQTRNDGWFVIKGPVEDAGLISFELVESGSARIDFASGNAEIFACEFYGRPFARRTWVRRTSKTED